MAKIFRFVLNVILVVVIVILAGYIALNIYGKTWIYRVQTGSMEFGIHVGDYILVLKKDTYDIGDIITYRYDSDFVTHRIVKKGNGTIVTKGDANNVEDEEISVDKIVGKVIYSGKLLNIIINYRFSIIATLLALYLLSMYIGDGKEKGEKENNEKEEL